MAGGSGGGRAARAPGPQRPPAVPAPPAAAPRGLPPAPVVTRRELEVLQLVAEGLSNKEVASRLRISEHTAKFHVAKLLQKLGVESRSEAVFVGVRLGLLLV